MNAAGLIQFEYIFDCIVTMQLNMYVEATDLHMFMTADCALSFGCCN